MYEPVIFPDPENEKYWSNTKFLVNRFKFDYESAITETGNILSTLPPLPENRIVITKMQELMKNWVDLI